MWPAGEGERSECLPNLSVCSGGCLQKKKAVELELTKTHNPHRFDTMFSSVNEHGFKPLKRSLFMFFTPQRTVKKEESVL